MTILWGDTGRVVTGPLKTFTITYATPRETLSGTPTALPSANPGSASAQASFTIASGDLPTYSFGPTSVQYTACVYIGGKNTDAATQTINYQCYKNGATVSGASGTQSVATNTFWTQSHFRFNGCVSGDTLAVSVWCSSANVNYDYVALIVYPSRVQLGKAYINKDVNYQTLSAPSLTQGNPSVALSNTPNLYPSNSASNNVSIAQGNNFGALSWNSTYGAFVANYGDGNVTSIGDSNATYRPYYRRNTLPTMITFREILR